ncbi:MAG TPA: AAA family ATPase [Anaeromyxobacteraceae bacterium]|nr:AAA family ATPase [Anaeromyxobacteraceae bacterium]
MTIPVAETAREVREALADACRGLVERETLVDLVTLSAVAGEHLLVIGPPGTAKSEAVRRAARATDGRIFEYLLGRFTEPSEIFGPVDLRRLREGFVETETHGMLPEAEFAFLDEVFQGSTAILNTLLGILNERTFRRGHTSMACPLRVCVGASNALPEEDGLAAFADRFLVRAFLDPVPGPRLEDLLEGGWALGRESSTRKASTAHLDRLSAVAREADLAQVRPFIAHAIRSLRSAGIALSDRRAVRVQGLVAAAAALAGRTSPGEADLWPIVFAVPTPDGQALARDVLRSQLARAENGTLPAATEEASAGPLARAGRLERSGNEILEARPADGGNGALERWTARLESVAREIDAGFTEATRPAGLTALRARIVEVLGPR